MRTLAGESARGPVVSSTIVVGALGVLAATVLADYSTLEVSLVVALTAAAAVAYRTLLSWKTLLSLLALVILLIPIRRYTMPGSLPFEPEPYRIFVALIVAGWLASLLVDPRVRLRATGLEGPLALILVAAVASVLVNPARVSIVETDVVKKLSFLISFIVVVYLVASVARRQRVLDFLAQVLVGGAAVVALCSLIEGRTGYNVFNHLAGIVPLLRLNELPDVPIRGARLRVYGSAQHPIALSAMFVLLVPLAVYLGRKTQQRRWWIALGLLGVGCLSTVSRTAVLMLLVVGVVFLWLRPKEVRRLLPLAIPVLAAVHVLLPGTLGSLRQSFFPEGGLLAEQQAAAGWYGSGRIADIGPSLADFSQNPLLGQGFGTRIVDWRVGGYANILDNQWLGTLLETGVVGVVGWIWLFSRAVRVFGREARSDDTDRGWLLAAIAAGIAAFAIGMLTYDAFAFVQVTFVMFLLLAMGAAVARPTAR